MLETYKTRQRLWRERQRLHWQYKVVMGGKPHQGLTRQTSCDELLFPVHTFCCPDSTIEYCNHDL